MDPAQSVQISRRIIGPGHPAYIIAEVVSIMADRSKQRSGWSTRPGGPGWMPSSSRCSRPLAWPVGLPPRPPTSGTPPQRLPRWRCSSIWSCSRRTSPASSSTATAPESSFWPRPLASRTCASFWIWCQGDQDRLPGHHQQAAAGGSAAAHLPILLSTGASEHAEIDQAYDLLARQCRVPLVLLHCVSSVSNKTGTSQPPPHSSPATRYLCPVGFSDHTLERFTGPLAVAAGADVLEKHFTLDRSQSGPDHTFSQTPGQLLEYVMQARRAESALGSGASDLGPDEQEVRRVSRCSVTAALRHPRGQRDHPRHADRQAPAAAASRPGRSTPLPAGLRHVTS